jgi:hypothetical protein
MGLGRALCLVVALGVCAAGTCARAGAANGTPPCSFPAAGLDTAAGVAVTAAPNQSAGLTSVAYRPDGPSFQYLTYWCTYHAGKTKLVVQVSTPFPRSLYSAKHDQVRRTAATFREMASLGSNEAYVWVAANRTEHGSAYVRGKKVLLHIGRTGVPLVRVERLLAAVVANLPR